MRQIHSLKSHHKERLDKREQLFYRQAVRKMSSYPDNISLYYEYCKGMVLLSVRTIFRSYLRANTVYKKNRTV